MADSVTNKPYIPEEYSYKNKKSFEKDAMSFDSNAFMKLLLEQLKHQDPLSPMDNQQFVQQTSMMAMVERLTKMQTLMEESNSSLLNIREYEGLIGKSATYSYEEEVDGEKTKTEKTGTIQSVKMHEGKMMFQIGDNWVTRDKINGVESKGMTNDNLLDNTMKFTQMIGKSVTYKEQQVVDADKNPATTNDQTTIDIEKNGVVTSVSLKDNKMELTLDSGKKLTMDQVTGMSVQPENVPMDNSLKYAQMIGYNVTYQDKITNSDGSTTTNEVSSTITAVSMKNGLVEFVLASGQKIKPNQIIGYEVK
ncbi:MAG: flagellar hook assembly protein FlgD [Clostridia bacterium]